MPWPSSQRASDGSPRRSPGSRFGNPFLPERIELERQALGRRLTSRPVPSSAIPSDAELRGDVPQRPGAAGSAETLVEADPAAARGPATTRPRRTCSSTRTSSSIVLYTRYMSCLRRARVRSPWSAPTGAGQSTFWQEFHDRLRPASSSIPGRDLPSDHDPEIIFAGFFQIERAFTHDLPEDRRRLDAGGPAAGGGLAVDLHARHAAVHPVAAPDDGRRADPDRGPLRQRQGARRPGHRAVVLHPVRPRHAPLRGRRGRDCTSR